LYTLTIAISPYISLFCDALRAVLPTDKLQSLVLLEEGIETVVFKSALINVFIWVPDTVTAICTHSSALKVKEVLPE